ncbi:hypothetical protein [Xanthomonas sp. LMG 12461]|uniref:hypothetical protein n=1 Tax=Xanthomonas sp. LMG 12461 TaxID=2014543 RepID=UPI0012658911|nr:hypothetical protein [Xanthomonas sp. LMG 12461]KAB7765383.1 hypothetical protein CEK68_11840 [Xanthomonas sp. LMG 12461]
MAKRDILRAAKRRGITIVFSEYYWTATPGEIEMVPQWEIKFGAELDHDVEAIEFIETAEILESAEREGQG